jgi:hypothetical protein
MRMIWLKKLIKDIIRSWIYSVLFCFCILLALLVLFWGMLLLIVIWLCLLDVAGFGRYY